MYNNLESSSINNDETQETIDARLRDMFYQDNESIQIREPKQNSKKRKRDELGKDLEAQLWESLGQRESKRVKNEENSKL